MHQRRCGSHIGQHYRKRFFLARLALAQIGHGLCVVGIADEMKAAQTLDGDNGATTQELQRFGDRVASDGLTGFVEQRQLRPAFRTAIGFGVETTIFGPAVFAAATATERERCQTGAGTIIGYAATDRVAGAAVRAVGEGIAPAARSGIQHLGQAITADCRVVTDGGAGRLAATTFHNDKTVARRIRLPFFHGAG